MKKRSASSRQASPRHVAPSAAPAAAGRVFRFTYYGPPKEEALGVNGLRDADAFVELSPLLLDAGAYGGLVLNYPAPLRHDPRVIIPVDETFLTPSDLLVLTTRPPLDDDPKSDKKAIRRSFTSLETKVFNALNPYFGQCKRAYVALAHHLRNGFQTAKADRACVYYRVNRDRFAAYRTLRDDEHHRWNKGNGQTTGAYLIYKKPAWPGGPALLVTFGMNGTMTLLWNHFLGRSRDPHDTRGGRFSTVLERSRFLDGGDHRPGNPSQARAPAFLRRLDGRDTARLPAR